MFACQNSTASLFIFSSPARTDEWNQKVTITFANPVELPGEVSPAGTYVFEVGLGDTNDYDHFVRVYKESKDRLYGMFLTIPDYRLTRASKPIVEFAERPVGSPEAICAWSHTKDKTGHEFVYPRSEAMRLAQVNNRPVASMPDNTNSASESALKQRSWKLCPADRRWTPLGIRRADTMTGALSAPL